MDTKTVNLHVYCDILSMIDDEEAKIVTLELVQLTLFLVFFCQNSLKLTIFFYL